jgi:hypothetical protein
LDLALPYSTAFNPGFRENRDELLAYYSGGVALQPEEGLTLVHLLLLEWLGLRIFVDVNNSDLAGALASRENSLDDAEQAAAARSLVLRHARPGNSELEQFATGHGMSDVMLYLQSNRPGRPARSKPTWLQGAILSKPLMAVRGVQAIVRPYMPSITRSRRRVRVAVSVSGQLRGFQKAAATWHKLFTPEVETDVYVHTWSAIGRSSAEPFRTMLPFDAPAFCEAWRRLGSRDGAEAMHERYPSLFRALNHSERISPDELAKFYGTTPDRVVIEDDQAEPFRGYSNPQKMHYKICAAFDLAQMESGRYDLHVRIRPDLGFRFAAFSWRDLMSVCQSRPILFCERGFGVHYGNPMIGDQFAIGSPDAMRSYAHAWTTYLQMAQLRPAQCPPEFHGHITLAQVLWFNNIDALRAPIGFGGLVEAEKLSAAEIKQAIVADADQRHDATDVAYLAALEQDLAALQPRQTVR